MQTKKTEGQNAVPENEAFESSQDNHNLLFPFNAGFSDLKDVVAPDMITDYKNEQFEDGVGFIGFIVEQTATGIVHGASWAFRRLRR